MTDKSLPKPVFGVPANIKPIFQVPIGLCFDAKEGINWNQLGETATKSQFETGNKSNPNS
ncbi:hypothetical protein FNW02_29620 [Komarekiella sp. 'clone 1']|uniref:Uncharacterized protein n=1 Tax=Komarekiella delphini-convector SJRDD-AB1 TaxID=2593771 RepID=A0AA40T2R1_9NOST|nr:hypothetical protein [Komarekiella delphini-convector SJRDD-AB1]